MKAAATGKTVNFYQFVGGLAMALVFGLTMAQAAGAEKNVKGFTQSKSIGRAKDLCEIGGGSLTVKDSPFEGVKISKCTRSDEEGRTCAHGQKTTNCSYQIKQQSGGAIVVNHRLQVVVKDDAIAPTQTFDVSATDHATLDPTATETPVADSAPTDLLATDVITDDLPTLELAPTDAPAIEITGQVITMQPLEAVVVTA